MNGQYPRSMHSNFGCHKAWQLWIVLFWAVWRREWSGIVMLWEFKSNIYFLCMHHLEFGGWGLCFVSNHCRPVKLYLWNSSIAHEIYKNAQIGYFLLLLLSLEACLFHKASWFTNNETTHISSDSWRVILRWETVTTQRSLGKLPKSAIRLACGCQSAHCCKVFYEVKSSRRTGGEVV